MPKYLPASTRPWRIPIVRQHEPQPVQGKAGYQSFRQCLRWEFGFSCAFCLLHEADLFAADIEGSALTWIEHRVPKSLEESGRNQYNNCFYSCRFCNSAHGSQPADDAEGHHLLDPCRAAWGDRFELLGDELRPLDEVDAAFTHRMYDLDDPRKVTLRRIRRETLGEVYAFLSQYDALHAHLMEQGRDRADPFLIDLAQTMWQHQQWAARERERFVAVPAGAAACTCGDEISSLPEVLAEQLT